MIRYSDCIGCQACVDFCHKNAISFQYDNWGEGRATVDASLCNNCNRCQTICPALNKKINPAQKSVFACFSKLNRHTGSSGGMFYEIASLFINNGGVVFGAAFDSSLKLIHKKASSASELGKLCKSKYLHSDMNGVYKELADCLKAGLHVMFIGTPCQVSAVKNAFAPTYESQLLLVDFLCHGTGTQKVFDICIRNEEKKRNGRIKDFSFRAKARRNVGHSFIYKLLKDGKETSVSGYSFEFPYYNAYLKYNIFYEACYECKYAREERVSDITIGDFWGIHKYNKKLKDAKGVSMLSLNTDKGRHAVSMIRDKCVFYEYPIENASSNNEAFHSCVSEKHHASKRELAALLEADGEDALVEKIKSKQIKKQLIYVNTPLWVRKFWNRVKKR